MSTVLGLLAVILLVAASGFFVAVEFALVASDRSRLEALAEEGSWSAKLAVAALRRLSFHLSGAQLGITVTSLVLGFLTEPLAGRLVDPVLERIGLAPSGTISIVIALFLATVFQMVAGELVPKNIAISHAEATAQALSPAATIVHGVLKPAIMMFNGAANWTVRSLGIEPREEIESHRSLDELAYLINSSGDSGTLDPEAHSLLIRTLRFGHKTAADALTPRVHTQAVPVTATVADLATEAGESRHSRYPVFDGDLDDVRGIATITSIFETPVADRDTVSVAAIMREPLVVPETRDLIDILDDFRSNPVTMAVVVDEHGGTAGILTLEDVLEEIVGEVDDEHDEAQPLTVGVEAGVSVVGGTLHLDEVADASGLELPPGSYETVAGFVLDRLGRIPAAGDRFEHDGWTITVVEMEGLRIASLQLLAPQSPQVDR
jgi:CBS domain containing-hemolysin-like protein